MSKSLILSTGLALLCVLPGGCASQKTQSAEQELTKARTLVQQADKSNAQRYAAADLQRAHDELTSADRANSEKKYDQAVRLAEEAGVDADLAAARGNSGEAEHSAREIQQGIGTLKEETQRQPGNTSTPDVGTSPGATQPEGTGQGTQGPNTVPPSQPGPGMTPARPNNPPDTSAGPQQ